MKDGFYNILMASLSSGEWIFERHRYHIPPKDFLEVLNDFCPGKDATVLFQVWDNNTKLYCAEPSDPTGLIEAIAGPIEYVRERVAALMEVEAS